MKNFTIKLCAILLALSLLFMFVFCVFLPRETESNYTTLKEFPEFSFEDLFSGKYFKGISDYFSDTIFGRDTFVDFETKINGLYGLEEEEKLITLKPEESDPDQDQSLNDETSAGKDNFIEESDTNSDYSSESPESSFTPDESEPQIESQPEQSETEQGGGLAEISGSILIIGNRAMEIYYGSEKGAIRYAEILNKFADGLDSSVNVYSMVIPKSSAYYLAQATQEKYQKLAIRNKNNIDTISNTLSEKVIDVNIYDILGRHANEEIYARTDHHWTALGAYYASSVFAEKAGTAFDDISEFEAIRRPGYLGTYYYVYSSKDNNTVLQNNPEDFLSFIPDTKYTTEYYSSKGFSDGAIDESRLSEHNGFFFEISDKKIGSWYSTFILGDTYCVKAKSEECKNGRKLLIVKDSYGNALAPFMIEGFEEIYIVDGRKYTKNLKETINEFGITDVLFAECTFSAVGGDYLNALEELCK